MARFFRPLYALLVLTFLLICVSSSCPRPFEELVYASAVPPDPPPPVLFDEALPETSKVVYLNCYNSGGRLLVPLDDAASALSATSLSIGHAPLDKVGIAGLTHVWLRPLAEYLGYGVRWTGEGIVELTSPGTTLRLVMNMLALPEVSVSPLASDGGLTEAQRPTKAVSITFDDGPNPHCTPAILSILARYGASATFFCIGQEASRYPALLQDIVQSGSEVGNHTLSHLDLTTLGRTGLATELTSSKALLEALCGAQVRLVRPPFGKYSDAVQAVAAESEQGLALWNVDPRDWDRPDVSTIVSRVMGKVKPGDVVLLHERPETVLALPLILTALRARGVESVTMSALAARKQLK